MAAFEENRRRYSLPICFCYILLLALLNVTPALCITNRGSSFFDAYSYEAKKLGKSINFHNGLEPSIPEPNAKASDAPVAESPSMADVHKDASEILLSRGKPTRQKNEYERQPKGPAELAVDGNKETIFQRNTGNSCTHTSYQKNYPWWRVDLGQPSVINRVEITNRSDVDAKRLHHYFIYITDKDDPIPDDLDYKGLKTCEGFIEKAEENGALIVRKCGDVIGRYVTIYKKDSSTNENILSLCEAEVYGKIAQDKCTSGNNTCKAEKNQKCVPEGYDKYRCECLPGFVENENKECVNKSTQDKCTSGDNTCKAEKNQKCIPEGYDKYRCECLPGFAENKNKECVSKPNGSGSVPNVRVKVTVN